MYQQVLAQINAAAGGDRANFDTAANQLMIQYGLTPDLNSAGNQLGLGGGAMAALFGMMNPATERAAAQNTAQGTSILGRLIDQNNLAQDTIRESLAGRGMLDSGDEAFRSGQQGLSYNQHIYDALTRMLSNFTSDQGRLTGQLNQLYGAGGQLDKAMQDAWTRFIAAVRSGQVQLPAGYTLPSSAPTTGGPHG